MKMKKKLDREGVRIPDAPSPWKFLSLKLQSAEQPMDDDHDNYYDSTPRS